MPLTGDVAQLRSLGRSFRDLHTPNTPTQTRLLTPVKQEIKSVLREEFSRSVDPSGASWEETVRGRAALLSKKLPFAFEFGVRDGVVVGVGKSKRDLLDAHQEGHTFKARQVAAQKQFLTFDRNGRLVRKKRALNKKGLATRGTHQTFARAHTVGERVLPQRQIVPEGDTLPPLWEQAVERGLTSGMMDWHERAST
jgi:hypothetical protein